MEKIIFIQPGYAAHYRRPLFDRLRENYSLSLIFISGRFTYPSLDKGNIKCRVLYLHSEKDVFWPLRLLRFILLTKVDVIIASIPTLMATPLLFLVGKLRRKKIIIWTENWNLGYEYLQKPMIYRKLRFLQYKVIIWGADAIIVHGTYSLNYHLNLGIKKSKLFIANHSSFDLSLDSPEYVAENIPAAGQNRAILYFGRIIPRKGLDILIKAFHKLESEIEGV
jgi:glycosyltransferase involved in cell wall biosynthesis